MKKILLSLSLCLATFTTYGKSGNNNDVIVIAPAGATAADLATKIDKPTDPLDAGKYLQVNPAGDDVEFVDLPSIDTKFFDVTGFDYDDVTPAGPANPLSDDEQGDTIVEKYDNGTAYFERGATGWDLTFFNPSTPDDIDFFGFLTPFADLDLRAQTGLQTAYQVNNDSGAPLTVTYGSNLAPQTIVMQDGDTLDFRLSTVSGWNLLNAEGSTVETATARFTSTNGVCVSPDREYQSNEDGTTHAIPSAFEYNEFLNNYKPQYIALSYEAAGGSTAVINVNGTPAVYKDLLNATDAGNGQVNFASGANSNYNRRARIDGEVLKNVGDYVEISGINVASFSTMQVAVLENETDLAHSATGVYKLFSNAGANQNTEGYSFRDPDNTIVNSGSETNATYRITRTLGGVSFSRNTVENYCTEVTEFTDYSSQTNVVSTSTGYYRVGNRHSDQTVIANTNDTEVVTGHDLTQANNGTLKLSFSDVANNHHWQTLEIDVDSFLARVGVGVDYSLLIYSTAYVQVFLEDAATGTLRFVDVNREMQYEWSELWVVADNQSPLFELANVTTITTTATFQNVGDPDAKITGDDGDRVFIEYGDGNRDAFVFLDGIAKAERKGFSTNDIEIIVGAGNQLQVRDVNAVSGILKVWYEQHIDAGVINTGTSGVSADANNSLILGADGLPFYEDIDTVAPILDPISDFDNPLKIDFLTLPDGRPYTVIEDNATTAVTTDRAFNSLNTPFVEIEVLRDQTATHGPMLRANEPGTGRQAQLRLNLIDDTHTVANSGANTSLPIVREVIVEEETIKYIVEFTDPVAHTELEISPAGHDSALTPSTAETGSTGIVGIKLYDSYPVDSVYDDTALSALVALNTAKVTDDDITSATLSAANVLTINEGATSVTVDLSSIDTDNQVIVSTDANNSITAGADGGAFYNNVDMQDATLAEIRAKTVDRNITAENLGFISKFTVASQTAVGVGAGENNIFPNQTAFGLNAGKDNSASNQTAIGMDAGLNNAFTNQTAVGKDAGKDNGNTFQTAVGTGAGINNTGTSQSVLGANAGSNNTGHSQTAMGTNAGSDNTGVQVTQIGISAGKGNSGDSAVSIGILSSENNSGIRLTAVGATSAQDNSGDDVVAIGALSATGNTGDNVIAIGVRASQDRDNTNVISIGNDSGNLSVADDSIYLGMNAGLGNTFADSIVIGHHATALTASQAGEIVLGNPTTATALTSRSYTFNVDQAVAGLDGQVLTFNEGTGEIELKANVSNQLNAIGTAGATQAIDFTQGHNVSFDLTAPTTLTFTDPNIEAGMLYVRVVQDATGGHVITWPANVLGDTTLIGTAANSNTLIPLYFDGTNYHL